ncbi:MAG: tryptophan halogenase [Dehalococcoidales bacterium]|nr:tryptophan halogenase [Dehalococcoidales bacterium]
MQTNRVLIVGGGSAGWTAAAYLNATLNVGDQKVADISLVESPNVPRIGVGEATIPNINHTLAAIGIDELDFMKAVDGTFKQSIRYVNWLDNKGEFYHHPFSRFGTGAHDDAGRRWLMSDRSVPFMNTISAQPILCEMGLAPKVFERVDLGIPVGYAFHMDALKFADYLHAFATARGVTDYEDHVISVDMHENGNIAAVNTESGKRLEADLFVDCTGFAAQLIEKKLGVGFTDCSRWLLCDRAVTMNVPHDHYYPGYVRPYTTASALSAGWVWEIPLQTRRSLGYVHSSTHISDDEAERELRAFEGNHSDSLPTRIVDFVVGRREQPWTANCVSIGLSGGFIEPLESTGLYLAQAASALLAEHFPHTDDMAPLAFRFNRIMQDRFYEILDFINMHYCLTRRTDTEFWREVRRPEMINDRLQAKFDYWKIKPPSVSDFIDQFFTGQAGIFPTPGESVGDGRCPIDTGGLWNHHSYEAILYGMDFLRDECNERYGENRPRPFIHKKVIDAVDSARDKLPPHDVWLRRMVGMPDYTKG